MRILHVFRSPVGGLFRHVIDLAKAQASRGHEVGVFCSDSFAGDRNEGLLADLSAHLALGANRARMERKPHWTDVAAIRGLHALAARTGADVLHGHGSKGGLYARANAVMGKRGPIRAYTPHGGSLHYDGGTPIDRLYMGVERLLERGTDIFLFESRFVAERFHRQVGNTSALTHVVLNGLHPEELDPVERMPDAADFLYIGEFRWLKGIDNVIAAMADLLQGAPRPPTLALVGQGPDEQALRDQVKALGLDAFVTFHKPMAAREAFRLARVMIVPSRMESMPYVVIEAAGARMPLISTDVGGIPEIFGAESHRLIPADDVPALAFMMAEAMAMSDAELQGPAARLHAHIGENFSVEKMTDVVLDGYAAARNSRAGGEFGEQPERRAA